MEFPTKYLIIVDPQNDFIEGGSLAVDGAKKAMERLSFFVSQNARYYEKIFVTQDFHPENHCSFTENGGTWPKHCVANTNGADIFPKLKEVLADKENVVYTLKGKDVDVDQYSIFSLKDGDVTNKYGKEMLEELQKNPTFHIDICGIAGDVCVLNTANDLVQLIGADRLYILEMFTASLDGGAKLRVFAEKNSIDLI